MPTYVFGGVSITKPGVYSVSDVSAYVAPNYNATGIIGAVAEARGGTPFEVYTISSLSSAAATFKSGVLYDGISLMYRGGAYEVKAVRVAGAGYLQATANFADTAAASVLTLTAVDYGTIGNYIKARFQTATNAGVKATIYNYWDGTTEVFDDLQNLFSVMYNGTATSTFTLSVVVSSGVATSISVAVAGDEDATAAFTIDLTLTAYETVGDVLEAMIGLPKMTVTQSAYCDDLTIPCSYMDAIDSADITTSATTVTAKLGTIIHALNEGSTLVTAAKYSATVTNPVATSDTYTTLASGNDGAAVTSDDYASAIATLEAYDDINLIWLGSGDSDDQSELFTHVQSMSTTKNRRERIGVVGLDTTANTTADYIARALTFNSERMIVAAPGIKITVDDVLTAKPSYYTAALLAGAIVAKPLRSNVTYQAASVEDMNNYYTITEIEDLMSHGVTVLEYNRRAGFRWNNGYTTYVAAENLAKKEINAVRIIDALSKDMRNYLEDLFIGKPMTNAIRGDIQTAVIHMLDTYVANGCLVGSDTLDAYRNVTVTVSNGVAVVTYEASPAMTLNYIFVKQTFSPAYEWVSATI